MVRMKKEIFPQFFCSIFFYFVSCVFKRLPPRTAPTDLRMNPLYSKVSRKDDMFYGNLVTYQFYGNLIPTAFQGNLVPNVFQVCRGLPVFQGSHCSIVFKGNIVTDNCISK